MYNLDTYFYFVFYYGSTIRRCLIFSSTIYTWQRTEIDMLMFSFGWNIWVHFEVCEYKKKILKRCSIKCQKMLLKVLKMQNKDLFFKFFDLWNEPEAWKVFFLKNSEKNTICIEIRTPLIISKRRYSLM